MRDIYKTGLVDGTEPFDVSDSFKHSRRILYLFQFTVRDAAGDPAVPAAGTVTIKPTLNQQQPVEDVSDNQVDLTARTNWMQEILGSYRKFDVVIDSLSANHTVELTIRPVSA